MKSKVPVIGLFAVVIGFSLAANAGPFFGNTAISISIAQPLAPGESGTFVLALTPINGGTLTQSSFENTLSSLLRAGQGLGFDGGGKEPRDERAKNTEEKGKNELSSAVPFPAVPIPTAAWLLGSGLIGLLGIARRKLAAV